METDVQPVRIGFSLCAAAERSAPDLTCCHYSPWLAKWTRINLRLAASFAGGVRGDAVGAPRWFENRRDPHEQKPLRRRSVSSTVCMHRRSSSYCHRTSFYPSANAIFLVQPGLLHSAAPQAARLHIRAPGSPLQIETAEFRFGIKPKKAGFESKMLKAGPFSPDKLIFVHVLRKDARQRLRLLCRFSIFTISFSCRSSGSSVTR